MFGALLQTLISSHFVKREKKILLISILVFCTKIKSLCQIVGRQVLRFEVTGGVVSGCW